MIHIVLYQPEIPPNTGNIARLCAATATPLHLIKPLGFSLGDRYLKRAGLDYWEFVDLYTWENIHTYLEEYPQRRLVTTSAKGGVPLQKLNFTNNDSLIFGPETRGLPTEIFELAQQRIWIPQLPRVRSLNLSTAAGIILYQALINCGEIASYGDNGFHK